VVHPDAFVHTAYHLGSPVQYLELVADHLEILDLFQNDSFAFSGGEINLKRYVGIVSDSFVFTERHCNLLVEVVKRTTNGMQ